MLCALSTMLLSSFRCLSCTSLERKLLQGLIIEHDINAKASGAILNRYQWQWVCQGRFVCLDGGE